MNHSWTNTGIEQEELVAFCAAVPDTWVVGQAVVRIGRLEGSAVTRTLYSVYV